MDEFFRMLAVGAILLGMTGPAGAETEPAVIRIAGVATGVGKPVGVGLLGIAQVKGFIEAEFKDTPVRLEWIYPAGLGPEVNEGFATGQIDFAYNGGLPLIISRAGGVRTKLLLAHLPPTTCYLAVRRGLPIESVKDLKGHSIAVMKATILHFSLLKLLEANGLSEKDVTLVDLKGADQLAAIAAGRVDAVLGNDMLLVLRGQGLVTIVDGVRSSEPRSNLFSAFEVSEAFERSYPEAVTRLVRALVKTAHWASLAENRDEVLKIWTASGAPLPLLQEEFAQRPLRPELSPLFDDYVLGQFQGGVALAHQHRLIRNDVALEGWVEPRYLEAALAALGLQDFWQPRARTGEVVTKR